MEHPGNLENSEDLENLEGLDDLVEDPVVENIVILENQKDLDLEDTDDLEEIMVGVLSCNIVCMGLWDDDEDPLMFK